MNHELISASPAHNLSGAGQTDNTAIVDAIPNMIIGAFALFLTSWSFVSMYKDSMLKTCGWKFASWSCAGFTSTWIASWAVGGIEIIFWTIALLVPSFRPIWFEIANLWTYAGTVLLLLPIVWWILAIA